MFNAKIRPREALGPDDAKLLTELVQIAIRNEWPSGLTRERVDFLIAKLKRLSK